MSIEKEFVPYQESFELKKIGFDEPCLVFINHIGQTVRYMNPNKDWNSIYNQTLKNSQITLPNTCTTPTFSQAFRWFREKYGLWQIVMQNADVDWTYDIMPIIGMKDYKLFDVFPTYEEAELACLRKLIEIVKQKQ